jgi:hypothetical protein
VERRASPPGYDAVGAKGDGPTTHLWIVIPTLSEAEGEGSAVRRKMPTHRKFGNPFLNLLT